MGDMSALEILNPNRGKPAPSGGGQPPVNQPPAGQTPTDTGGAGLDPAKVQALVNGIKTLRQMNFGDDEIVDIIMQAVSMQALQISEDQVRQIVEAVPGGEAAGSQPPEGGQPPQMPPQGAPNINNLT